MKCEYCDGMGVSDVETKKVCRYCHGTGDAPEDQLVKLETMDTKRHGTLKQTAFSAVFVRLNASVNLNGTELRVLSMIRQDRDYWKCGCVTGYPETFFSDFDYALLKQHGIGKRFEE